MHHTSGRPAATPNHRAPTDSVAEPSALSCVREVPLAGLRAWPENPRLIAPERLAALKEALVSDRKMLAARPLIAWPDGTVICGNQRLLAAQELGWSTIPVLIVELDPERARLWALRDNNQFGHWDEAALGELLAELAAGGVELALTGFAGGEIDQLLAGIAPAADPDDIPELPPPGTADSKLGVIYQLGRHRLACGDARDPGLLARLVGEERPEVLWTDPPYGVCYIGKTSAARTIANDDRGAGTLLEQVLQKIDGLLADSARFYLCSPAGPQGTEFRLALRTVDWTHHQTLVWVKNTLVLGHSDHHYRHEDVLYGYRPGAGRPGRGRHQCSRWQGGNDQSSVFFVDRPARSEQHPTMKPVALITAMLRNSSVRGDAVFDPFAGSGSTLIACEQTGRRCLAVELDPGYCDVIRQRHKEYSHDR